MTIYMLRKVHLYTRTSQADSTAEVASIHCKKFLVKGSLLGKLKGNVNIL